MTSGNQKPDSTPIYPDDSFQNFIEPDPWWVDDGKREFEVGRLVKAILPFVDQNPYALETIGRAKSTEHKEALVRFVPIDIKSAIDYSRLPVAPLPQYPGETGVVYRAKKRPALIIHAGCPDIPSDLRKDKPRYQTDACILVVPFFTAESGGGRAGYTPAFVERVRRCEYPQFFWDILPESTAGADSLMKLDHIQPVGRNHSIVEVTNYRLSDLALEIMKQFFNWFFHNQLPSDSLLYGFKVDISRAPYLCN
jgi:hypothetical protein